MLVLVVDLVAALVVVVDFVVDLVAVAAGGTVGTIDAILILSALGIFLSIHGLPSCVMEPCVVGGFSPYPE